MVTESWVVQDFFVVKNYQMGIIWKLSKRGHSFLHGTHHLCLIHIPIKLYEDTMNNE